jgi:hypothetical protein
MFAVIRESVAIARPFAEDWLCGEQPGPPNSNRADARSVAFALPKRKSEESSTYGRRRTPGRENITDQERTHCGQLQNDLDSAHGRGRRSPNW